jgi:hypothetical protein
MLKNLEAYESRASESEQKMAVSSIMILLVCINPYFRPDSGVLEQSDQSSHDSAPGGSAAAAERASTAGLQKVSEQVALSRPEPQFVPNPERSRFAEMTRL